MNGSQPFGIHIAFVLIAKNQTGYAALRIHIIHIENILLTVQRHDSQLVGIGSKGNSRNIIITFHRHFQFFDIFCRYAVRVNRYFRILLACFRIFEIIISRIQSVTPHLHGIFRHFAFVETHISQIFTVGRPGHQVSHSEFFFIYPIGNAVQYFVQFTVFGNLYFRIIVKLTNPYIIIHDISTHASVRRISRNHLLVLRIGNRLYIVTAHVIIVHHRLERTTVNRFGFPPNKDMMAGTADIVSVKIIECGFTGSPGIEQCVHRITCTIRVFDNHTPIFIHCCIMFSIRQRPHFTNSSYLTELSICNFF